MMKSSKAKKTSTATGRHDGAGGKFVSQVELLRMRVAAATATLKQAKEHVSQAKRRRKLAKLMARRAKKEAKIARANLDELREALADAHAQTTRPAPMAARTVGKRKSTRAVSRKRPARRRVVVKSRSGIVEPLAQSSTIPPAATVENTPGTSDAGVSPGANPPGETSPTS